MGALDIFIFVLIAVAAVVGFVRGIVSQVGSIAAIIVGILAARIIGGAVVSGSSEPVTAFAIYGIIFLVAYLVTWLLARMIRSAVKALHLGIIDRLTGAVFSVFKWTFILSIVLNIYMFIGGESARSMRDSDHTMRCMVIDLSPTFLGAISATGDDAPAVDEEENERD
ncbi:MAG: CvpA family protein [Muribaculaceae bacterium]